VLRDTMLALRFDRVSGSVGRIVASVNTPFV